MRLEMVAQEADKLRRDRRAASGERFARGSGDHHSWEALAYRSRVGAIFARGPRGGDVVLYAVYRVLRFSCSFKAMGEAA